MNVDEFIARVRSEPERVKMREVRPASLDLLDAMRERRAFPLVELLRVAGPPELREFRYRHILGPPVTTEALAGWNRRYPNHPLPDDLCALLATINGIHLWADAKSGRSYYGIAPIEEWDLASVTLGSRHPCVVLSYQFDEADAIVLDTERRRYFPMDVGGDLGEPIGDSIEALLDHVWKHRLAP